MSIKSARRRSIVLLAGLAICSGAAVLSACSDDDNGPSSNGSVAIALAPTTIDVPAGASGTTSFTITRTAPFTAAVTIAASGQPAGFVVTIDPGLVAAGATTGAIEVSVPEGTANGNYPITISASGNAISSVSTTLTVAVVDAPPAVR